MADLEILEGLTIPEEELSFTASRSGGPGGQHVNKVSSRVTLTWDLASSPSVSAEQKDVLRVRLAKRINEEGIFRLSVSETRSQAANRRLAVERFVALLSAALAPRPPRRPTRPTAAGRERRLQEKKVRSRIKRARGGPEEER